MNLLVGGVWAAGATSFRRFLLVARGLVRSTRNSVVKLLARGWIGTTDISTENQNPNPERFDRLPGHFWEVSHRCDCKSHGTITLWWML